MPQEQMTLDRVIGTILVRDKFRYDRFNYTVRILATILVILAISVVGNFALMGSRLRFQYMITDDLGRLMKLVPLSDANMSDADVAKWTVEAVTRLNTFDFANYREQFLYAQKVLTGVGWVGFQKALTDSGNFASVVANRYVTTSVPSGPAVVNFAGRSKGSDGSVRYVWSVTFPMIITYRSSTGMSISQGFLVTATVVRMPEFINADGLGIRQIIGEQNAL